MFLNIQTIKLKEKHFIISLEKIFNEGIINNEVNTLSVIISDEIRFKTFNKKKLVINNKEVSLINEKNYKGTWIEFYCFCSLPRNSVFKTLNFYIGTGGIIDYQGTIIFKSVDGELYYYDINYVYTVE